MLLTEQTLKKHKIPLSDFNTKTGVTSGAGTAYPSGAHEFTSGF
jgi:hypothetical protein